MVTRQPGARSRLVSKNERLSGFWKNTPSVLARPRRYIRLATAASSPSLSPRPSRTEPTPVIMA